VAILKQEYLLDYIGKTATPNILNDAKKWLLENKMKEMGYLPRPNVICLVHTQDKKYDEILQIGGSTPPDLISDNMGELFAEFHRAVSSGAKTITLQDTTDTTQSFAQFWRSNQSLGTNGRISMFSTFSAVNAGIQIGKGSAQVTRQDFKIEDPFTNGGLEDSRNLISTPAYNVALSRCEFGVSITSTGAGIISETAHINSYHNTTAHASSLILMAHDNINPVVNFISAQSIFTEYIYQL